MALLPFHPFPRSGKRRTPASEVRSVRDRAERQGCAEGEALSPAIFAARQLALPCSHKLYWATSVGLGFPDPALGDFQGSPAPGLRPDPSI